MAQLFLVYLSCIVSRHCSPYEIKAVQLACNTIVFRWQCHCYYGAIAMLLNRSGEAYIERKNFTTASRSFFLR